MTALKSKYYTFDRETELIRNQQIEKALSFGVPCE